MNEQDIVIETRQLTCCFGSFTAVDALTIRIPRGVIYGFIGSNGSGKSTTIRMLCGLLPPSAGKALVLGQDVAVAQAAVKPQLGYMSQKFSLYHDLTTRENLDFYAGLYGLTGALKRTRIAEILALLKLEDKAEALAGPLSGGQRQRLALGCAILHRPPILILDEPTSAVDPASRRMFWNLLAELVAQDATTVLVTTHFMDEAEHCDLIGLLHDGRLLASGSPRELKAGLPVRLIKLNYATLATARQALAAARLSYVDAYAFGQQLHVLLAREMPLPTGLCYDEAPLTMEDVFIFYDQRPRRDGL